MTNFRDEDQRGSVDLCRNMIRIKNIPNERTKRHANCTPLRLVETIMKIINSGGFEGTHTEYSSSSFLICDNRQQA